MPNERITDDTDAGAAFKASFEKWFRRRFQMRTLRTIVCAAKK